ncbi:MAG: type III pantothenate kinase [Planctomycetota bacterium]
MNDNAGFLAVDVGSSRVKIGWFPSVGDCVAEKQALSLPIAASPLRQPDQTLAVAHQEQAALWATVGAWLEQHCPHAPPGYLASVHPPAAKVVQELFGNRLREIMPADVPIETRVDQPHRVGMDRLLSATAANRIRPPDEAAIVVDLGTACTVDLIGADGVFEGGAILPGLDLSASSLHVGTASLPKLTIEDLGSSPPTVGKSTQAAIASGLYWGIVGAVRELVGRISSDLPDSPQVIVTGGGGELLVEHLAAEAKPVRCLPNLILSGIAAVVEDGS